MKRINLKSISNALSNMEMKLVAGGGEGNGPCEDGMGKCCAYDVDDPNNILDDRWSCVPSDCKIKEDCFLTFSGNDTARCYPCPAY